MSLRNSSIFTSTRLNYSSPNGENRTSVKLLSAQSPRPKVSPGPLYVSNAASWSQTFSLPGRPFSFQLSETHTADSNTTL